MKRIFVAMLALVLALAMLASCSFTPKKNSQLLDQMTEAEIQALRETVVYKTENFSINGTMMKYILNDTVMNLYAFGASAAFDTSKPLSEQEFNLSSYELFEAYVENAEKYKSFSGTWYDFFWEIASDKAKETLAVCELAKMMGIELTAKEIEKIESSLFSETIKYSYFYGNGFSYQQIVPGKNSFNAVEGDVTYSYVVEGEDSAMDGVAYYPVGGSNGSFVVNGDKVTLVPAVSGEFVFSDFSTIFEVSIGNIYGAGVTQEDIHSVMKLEALAEKCYNAVSEEARSDIQAEIAKINAYYEANKNSFLKADYLSYSIPNYRDVEYRVGLLSSCKTEDEFRAQVLEIMLWDTWDEYYEKTLMELQKDGFGDGRYLADIHYPNHEAIAGKITVAQESIISGMVGGKAVDELDDYSDTIFDEAITFVRDTIYEKISEQYAKITVDHAKQGDKSEADAWTFAEERATGDISSFGKTYKEDPEGVTEVRFIVKPRYTDETPAVSFGHILVSSNADKGRDALKEAESILSQLRETSLDAASFEAVAESRSDDTEIIYRDVVPGETVAEINDWIFSSERKVGDLEMIKTSAGYSILYFMETSDLPSWQVEVIDVLTEEEMSTFTSDTREGCQIEYCGDDVKKNIAIVAAGGNYSSSSGNSSFDSFGNGDFAVVVPSGNKIEVKE